MEPLGSAASAQLLRPAAPVLGETGTPLREGRVLVGEVLQKLDGSTFLLAMGGQRVPAESNVELQPGDHFLARVERHGSDLALRLLGESRGATDSALLAAVRALMADERPLGVVLQDLAALLRSELEAQGGKGARIEALLAAIEGRVLNPEGGGEALRALLTDSGSAYAAALTTAAAATGADDFEAALRALATRIRAELVAAGVAQAELELLDRSLAVALRGMAGQTLEGRLDAGTLERLARQLAGGLSGELTRAGAPESAQWLAGGRGERLLLGSEGLLLRALANLPGGIGRSPLATSLTAAALASLGNGLRGRLALEMIGRDAGPVREAMARALAGLDLEELLNAARREAGEPRHFSLPLPDGALWTTAHMLLVHREGRDAEGRQGGGEESFRVVLGVEFSRLGKVRADLLVRQDAIAARLRASRPETAQRLRRASQELGELLGSQGRRVTLTVLDATPEETEVANLSHDIRFLREHHLMDVSG